MGQNNTYIHISCRCGSDAAIIARLGGLIIGVMKQRLIARDSACHMALNFKRVGSSKPGAATFSN
jgi:hypothetical protein